MSKLRLLFVLYLSTCFYSQNIVLKEKEADSFLKGSTSVFFKNDNVISRVYFNEQLRLKAGNFSTSLKKQLKMSDAISFKVNKTETDDLGFKHIKYDQYYNNIRVEDAQFITHEKNSVLKRMNGLLYQRISVKNKTNFSKKDVYRTLKNKTSNGLKPVRQSEPELVITENKSEFYLCYKIHMENKKKHESYYYYINAETGNLVKQIPLNHYNNQSSSTKIQASGVSLYNGTVNMDIRKYSRVSHHVGNHAKYSFYAHLHDPGRGQGNKNFYYKIPGGPKGSNTEYSYTSKGLIINDHGSSLFYDTEVGFPLKQAIHYSDAKYKSGVSALWALQKTYDYFKTKSFIGFNGQNSSLVTTVNLPINGAYYNSIFKTLNIGKGDQINYNNLASLKVMAHEFTHGVTNHTADLIYTKESGALNESFSDIFAIVLDFYVNNSSNWLIGDLVKINGAMRSMNNPNLYNDPDTYQGTHWVNTNVTPSPMNDYAGVHTNSGVQNYWFYLLSNGGSGTNDNGTAYNVNGIGIEKAAAIALRNLRYELTRSSGYNAAMNGSLEAAKDLYGINSTEYLAVAEAWKAVGLNPLIQVYASISGPGSLNSGQNGNFSVSVTGGTSPYTIKWYKKLSTAQNWSYLSSLNNLTNVQISQTVTSSQSLSVKASVTDANNTTHDAVKTVQINSVSLNLSISGPVFLLSGQSGTYSLSISGGSSPYTISWAQKVSSTPNGGTWFTLGNYNNQTQISTSAKVSSSSTLSIRATVTDNNGYISEKIFDCELEPFNKFSLNNFPNPFNPNTVIQFTLKNRSNVSLFIYNSLGQKVKTLINNSYLDNSIKHAYIWNAKNDFGQRVSSGIYFYKLLVNNDVFTKKMVLMK